MPRIRLQIIKWDLISHCPPSQPSIIAWRSSPVWPCAGPQHSPLSSAECLHAGHSVWSLHPKRVSGIVGARGSDMGQA